MLEYKGYGHVINGIPTMDIIEIGFDGDDNNQRMSGDQVTEKPSDAPTNSPTADDDDGSGDDVGSGDDARSVEKEEEKEAEAEAEAEDKEEEEEEEEKDNDGS